MALQIWLAFLAAAIIIAITPGPGAAISMSSGLRYGYRKTVRAICGLQTALLIQLLIVAAGLGALLIASPLAFDTMKFVGASYLAWLGIQKWRSPTRIIDDTGSPPTSNLFAQGLLINLTNPKAIIFMAALTPQFIDVSRPQAMQFVIMGITICCVDIIVMSCYALLALHLRKWLKNPKAMRVQDILFGSVFLVAGILLAISSKP